MSGSRTLAVASLLVLLLEVRTARATPSFPGALAAELGIPEPGCSLCHVGAQQRGTVTTAFGTSMRSRGLVAYDQGSLRVALRALEAEKKDSDGDGTPDIAELKAGTDPSAVGAASAGDAPPVPDYGCQAGRGPHPGAPLGAGALLATLLALRTRRSALASVGRWRRRLRPSRCGSTPGTTPRSWR